MNWILALVVPGTNIVGIAAAMALPGRSILRPLTEAGTTQGLVHIRHIKMPPVGREGSWQIPRRVYSEYSKRRLRLERLIITQQLH